MKFFVIYAAFILASLFASYTTSVFVETLLTNPDAGAVARLAFHMVYQLLLALYMAMAAIEATK